MIQSSTKIWLYLFLANCILWLLLVSLRIIGYGFRGYYSNLIFAILSFLSLLIALHFLNRDKLMLNGRLRRWQKNIFTCLIAIGEFTNSLIIFIFLVYQLSGFASNSCMQEFTSPSGKSIVIKSCGLTCHYSFHHNYFLVTEIQSFAEINPQIMGKCLGNRFGNLKLEWNPAETEIAWQITDYHTTYHTTRGQDGNPKTPIIGKVYVR